MTAQVEVKFCGVGDAHVDGGACGDVATAACLVLAVGAEETGVVSLLHHDEGDAWAVVALQLGAGLADGPQLVTQHLQVRLV